MSLEVDEKAFKADMVMDVLKTEIAQASPIPALKQASLERVLRKVLARVAAASEACFVVRKDHIEITTGAARLAEFWPNGNENARANPEQPDQPANPPKVLPLVVMEFDNVPLSDALRELASATDYTIVLDARAGEKSKLPVTASLINVPLDTAVRMLADMAELKPVLLNSAIYVTTEKRADRFQPGTPFPGGMGAAQGAAQFGALGAPGALGGVGFAGIGGLGGILGGVPQSPFSKAVSVHVDNKALAAALNELTEGRPVQVLLDREHMGQRGTIKLAADLDRVSLETGIRLLADMADLAPVFIANVAYITTREKARNLAAELAPSTPAEPPMTAPPPAPPAPAPAPPPAPAPDKKKP